MSVCGGGAAERKATGEDKIEGGHCGKYTTTVFPFVVGGLNIACPC